MTDAHSTTDSNANSAAKKRAHRSDDTRRSTRRDRHDRARRTQRSEPGERGPLSRVTRAGRSGADRAAAFDEFYKDSRSRLLVQTLALTGDLTASRSAVRDAMVVAWHHWRKVGRQESPEDVVRGYAYRFGLRRRSARPWGRRKDGDEETRATLDSLASLTLPQRKAVILTQLAGVDMPHAAREIGVPLESAERELAAGAALFAHDRQIATSDIHPTLVDLERLTGTVTWPRPTIIRRAGGARRRAHTLLGVTGAIVIFAAAGAVVNDGSGLRPTLNREARSVAAAHASPTVEVSLPATALLDATPLDQRLGGAWTVGSTTDNSTGNGLEQPCQSQRYADPRGAAALVRHFSAGHGKHQEAFVQTAEASASPAAAQRAYKQALEWFTACEPAPTQDLTSLPRTHLVSTAVTPGLGDQSAVVVLHTAQPSHSYVVGVARTGLFTTAASLRLPPAEARSGTVGPQQRRRLAQVLGTAVGNLCGLQGGGTCAPSTVRVQDAPVFPVGTSSALLSEVDLPPVAIKHGRLVGTAPHRATGDRGASLVLGCDVAHLVRSYAGVPIRKNLTRTFVFVGSDLPRETGLTQVVGALPAKQAAAFPAQVSQQLHKCLSQDAGSGTQVDSLAAQHGRATDLRAWRLNTELPGNRSVEYDMAVVRSGGSLSQLIYISAPGARMARADFVALAQRALERVGRLTATP